MENQKNYIKCFRMAVIAIAVGLFLSIILMSEDARAEKSPQKMVPGVEYDMEEYAGSNDLFDGIITLLEPGTLQGIFNGYTRNIYYPISIELYTEDGNGGYIDCAVLGLCKTDDEYYECLPVTLPAGTYRIRWNLRDIAYGKIQFLHTPLTLSDGQEEEYNDTADTANRISTGKTVHGDFRVIQDADYYKFTLSGAGLLKTDFTIDTLYNYADVHVELYYENSKGNLEPVYQKLIYGKKQALDQIRVPAGTYYLKVLGYDLINDENGLPAVYSFRMNFTKESSASFEQEFNNKVSTANQIKTNRYYKGNLNSETDKDYFAIKVDKRCNLALELKTARNLPKNAFIATLYEEDGKTRLIYLKSTEDAFRSTGNILVEPGTYYVKVASGNGMYDSSESYNLCVKQTTWLKAPTVKTATAEYNSLKISWNKVSQADGYEIYRSTSEKGNYSCIKTVSGGSTLSCVNSGLTTGKTYYYKVRAFKKENGETTRGGFSSVKSGKPVPAAPAIKLSSGGSGKIKISWGKVSGASGYVIYRSSGKNGTYKAIKTITKGSTLSYTNSGLQKNRTYYYKVRAYRTVNGRKIYSGYSTVKSMKK